MIKSFLIILGAIVIGGVPVSAEDTNGRNRLVYCQSGQVNSVDKTKCKSLLSSMAQVNATYNQAIGNMMAPPNFETGELGQAIDDYNYYKSEVEYYEDLQRQYDYYGVDDFEDY